MIALFLTFTVLAVVGAGMAWLADRDIGGRDK